MFILGGTPYYLPFRLSHIHSKTCLLLVPASKTIRVTPRGSTTAALIEVDGSATLMRRQQLICCRILFSKSRPMRSLNSLRCSLRGPRKLEEYLPPFSVEPPFCCFLAPATLTYFGSLPQGSQRSCPTFSSSPTLAVLPCPPLPILTSRASARNRVGELQGMRLQRSAMSLLNSLSYARKSSLLSFALLNSWTLSITPPSLRPFHPSLRPLGSQMRTPCGSSALTN